MPQELPSIGAALARMQHLSATLDPQDGVACFNRMYLRATRAFDKSLTDGSFRDPEVMEALGAHFAGLYLQAVDAELKGDHVHPSWAPLFAARHDATLPRIRFALSGMITHINHDLPLAVVAVCRRCGITPNSKPFRADYLQMNRVLAQLEPEIRASFSATTSDTAVAAAIIRTWSRYALSALRSIAWVTS